VLFFIDSADGCTWPASPVIRLVPGSRSKPGTWSSASAIRLQRGGS
jgi:hypothetical protein